jgi:hypothetical protein
MSSLRLSINGRDRRGLIKLLDEATIFTEVDHDGEFLPSGSAFATAVGDLAEFFSGLDAVPS